MATTFGAETDSAATTRPSAPRTGAATQLMDASWPRGRRPEGAGHVGLRAADSPVEGRHTGEAARPGGQEDDHGLAERDDVHDVHPVRGDWSVHDVRAV